MPRSPRTNPTTLRRSVELRKESTPAEQRLWSRLRNNQLGAAFRRQHAIGKYIPDFCSPKAKLIIELDGGQHLDQRDYDARRTAFLESRGYRVLRFWNKDVIGDLDGVLRAIIHALDEADGR